MLQNRLQAQIGIVNLVVYRNYDGNRRIFFLRKVDFSVGQILLTDLKITFDKVLSIFIILPG